MESKFKIISYFIPIFILFLIGLFINIIVNIKSAFTSIYGGLFVVSLLFFSILMLFFEFRNKIIKVEFINNQFKINSFFGLTNTKIIDDKIIDGFYNSILETKYGSYDYIYLMSNNKKIIKISNQYHKNFKELSEEIKIRYKDLGFVNTGFISEIKDIFN
jgi:hypothetical protein